MDRIEFKDGVLTFPVGRLDRDEMRAIDEYIKQIYESGIRAASDPKLVAMHRMLLDLNDAETSVAYLREGRND